MQKNQKGQGLSEASVKRVVIPFMRVEHTSHSRFPKVLSLIMAILEVVSTWTMEGYNYSNCRNQYAENSNLPWVLGCLTHGKNVTLSITPGPCFEVTFVASKQRMS